LKEVSGMDHIFARLKTHSKNQFFKLISNYTLYEAINIPLKNCIPYEPDHNLDEDSWFKIEQFSQQPFCIDLLKESVDSKDFDDLKKENFPKIDFIFSLQGDDLFFQKITPSLYVDKKGIFYIGEAVKIDEGINRLIINEQPDAIYFKQHDLLVFRNLARISSIFKGIDLLYREATQQETESFLMSNFISLKDDYNANKVSKPNRKRIALAQNTLDGMSQEDKLGVLSYINDYCGDHLIYNEENQQFEISTDDDLKLLLYGVEQRFYTTKYGKEKRLANSIQRLG